jgi:Antitoxin Phd_YefM, type II toxin-antitoxin system
MVISRWQMASWGATQAKAQFSAVLDKAETEGPQLVRRRKREFYVLTKEQLSAVRNQTSPAATKPFVSAWDALRPSSGEFFDVDFPRLRSKQRVKF